MLTETSMIDKIEIVGEFKHIQIRRTIIIERNGLEIARSAHRSIVAPGDNVTGQDEKIQDLAALYHTPALVAEYQSHIQQEKLPG